MSDTTAAISGAAALVAALIKLIADALDEPVSDVRKRVLAQIEHDARDASDATDRIAEAIDASLPEAE